MKNINLEDNKKVTFAFASVGLYYTAKYAMSALSGFLKYCVLPRRNLQSRYGGGYALVTGSSDGIGKEYALNLARAGFDIILMARDQVKLDAVAKEIKERYNVKTMVIVYDFSKLASLASVEELRCILNKRLPSDVSILVNNVGCAKTGLLHKHSIFDAMRQINVNINA